jgi:hypothetical protein
MITGCNPKGRQGRPEKERGTADARGGGIAAMQRRARVPRKERSSHSPAMDAFGVRP